MLVERPLARGSRIAVVGVAVGGAVAWKTGSVIYCVIVAALVTAGLRAL